MKIVIAGLGSIGRRHLRNLRAFDENELLLLRTRKSTLPEEDLSDYPVVNDLTKALEWKPEAVIVANPTSLHLEVAIPFAQTGCHLLLEKPVSNSMVRIDLLQQAVEDGGSQVLVGFQYRFHPGLQTTKQVLDSGAIGKPISFRSHWSQWLPGWHPWEDYRQGYSARQDLGGGVVLTLCHPLDYLRWIFGDVRKLWAFTGMSGDLQIKVEDTAEIGLQYKNDLIGSVHLDYNGQPSAHYLEVIGTEGTLRWDNPTGTVSVFQTGNNKNAEEPKWELVQSLPGFERNQLFMDEIQHFLSVVRGEIKPVCTLEDGIVALKLALAALNSAKSSQIQVF